MKKHLIVWGLLFFLCTTPSLIYAVPNKIMAVPGAPVVFGDTGGILWNLTGLGPGAGQYSTRFDKNTIVSPSGAMPYKWTARCRFQAAVGMTVNDQVEWYIATSDGTFADGNLGTTAAALVTDKRKNLRLMMTTIVDQTAASVTMESSIDLEIFPRYYSLGAWNATTQSFLASTTAHGCSMTPMNLEIQAHVPLDYDKRAPLPALLAA
jgi:hypothetical protein